MWPAVRRPSATDAPEASETSCSEERPPASTATRWALIGRATLVVVVVEVVGDVVVLVVDVVVVDVVLVDAS